MVRPTVVPLTNLADAATVGVDLALQERTSASGSIGLPDPGTIGIWEPPPTTEPAY